MNRNFLALSVSAALLAATTAPVWAQTASDEIEQIVVTGTRTANLIENVPNTTELFSAADIENMGAVTVRDVLTKAGNVQMGAQKGGVNIRGLGADYTVILVNGRKPGGLENIKDFQSMITSTLNVNNIERIEVLRGQAGAMYGANAIGGVINIITKQSVEPMTVFSATVGNSTTKLSMVHDFGVNGNWDGTIAANFADVAGIEEDKPDGSGTTKTGDGYLGNINATVGYQVNDDNRVRTEVGYIVDRNKEYTDNVVSRDTDRTLLNTALIWDGYTDELNYSAGVSYNRTENLNNGHTDLFQDIVVDGQVAWEFNETHTFLVGGEFVVDKADTEVTSESLNRFAVFLQDEISLFDERVFLVPSVRYDDHETFGGQTTYQLGSTWEVIEDHRLKANVGTGYKAPTLMQLYGTEATGIGTFWGNPDLKPEESKNYELRYEYRGDRVDVNVGWYFNDVTDFLHREKCDYSSNCSFVDDKNPKGDWLRVNVGEVEIRGIETELAYRMTEQLDVTVSYNHIDAEVLEGEKIYGGANQGRVRLSGTAEDNFGLDLGYTNNEHDLTVNVWGNYFGDFASVNGKTGKYTIFDYYNFNAAVKKNFGDTYAVSFGAYNFLQSERDSDNDAALDPMEWRLTFDMKF
ncbi:TonB-dependent receptor plug domain-containing protein [Ferrimonas senticii]|uniref:TonB-dependent receptor plug domain-containing protein n=1 Tax=Ferrimonas senticii TaxID=394566 RepID=UPI0003F5550E|nr:TonB-dependent receptor [Ferrimonas senticii]